MRALLVTLIVIAAAAFTACNKTSDPEPVYFPYELSKTKADLAATFDTLDTDLAAATASVAMNVSDTTATRSIMLDLFNNSSFVIEFAFVNTLGIMQIIEPSVYYPTQGTYIGNQNHIIKCFQTKQPVLSATFFAVEGFYAAVDIHPVLKDAQLYGGITSLFFPETILTRIIGPLVKDQPFEIWVMEKGGKVIYDQDLSAIGTNVFTDSIYKPFPELIAAAYKIDTEVTGTTSYSFYQNGTTKVVVKKVYWDTFSLYGTEWKIIWAKPE